MKASIGFDLDMTLVDSNLGLIKTLGHLFPKKSEINEERFIQKISGLPLKEILGIFVCEDEIVNAEKAFMEFYPSIGIRNSRIYPGAVKALTCVKDAGYEPIIVSAKSPDNLTKMISFFDLPVSIAIGGVHGLGKTQALIENHACLYVGDQESDVASAHRAGIPALKILSPDKDSKFTHAEWTLGCIEDFPEWFNGWPQYKY
jgi:phosphoglycolate phosphatase